MPLCGGGRDVIGFQCIVWNQHIDMHKKELLCMALFDVNVNFDIRVCYLCVCVCVCCCQLLLSCDAQRTA